MEKKIAFITGGARGIGKSIALTLSKQGYHIALNYRSQNEELEQLKKQIEEEKVECLLVQGDISKFEDCEKMVQQTIEAFGKIDVLVNNAGIIRDGLFMRMSTKDIEDVIGVNLLGTFYITRCVAPYMIKQRVGRIINISSVVGVCGNAGQANYAASKAGIIGLTKSLAKELASRNILVNAVAPGFIATDMTDSLSDKVKEGIHAQIPLKRMGTAKEVANVVKFLASEDSSYITGQVLHIDGGMVM